MNTFKEIINNLPVPASGLAFGIAGLGLNWEKFHPMMGLVQIPSALIALTLASLVMIKLWLSPLNFLATMKDINIGPGSPTLPLVLMIVSVNLNGYLALAVWLFAVIMHITILTYFIVTRYRAFDFQEISPAWFIPFVAISIAAFTNPGLESTFSNVALFEHYLPSKQTINQAILFFAISSYLILLPFILFRIINQPRTNLAKQPALVLVAAPANLSLLGYLTLFEIHFSFLIILLFFLATSMTIFSYICIWKQRANGFTPALSSFTFPLVIGAPAMQAFSQFIEKNDTSEFFTSFFSYLANIQLYIAAITTLYVLYLYMKFTFTKDS